MATKKPTAKFKLAPGRKSVGGKSGTFPCALDDGEKLRAAGFGDWVDGPPKAAKKKEG